VNDLLDILAKAGGWVSEYEIRYQARRRGLELKPSLLDVLSSLEGEGLVKCHKTFELTRKGRERIGVPGEHHAVGVAGTWTPRERP
jgi:DNA-binding PadR family transcriptional regulator